MRRITWLNACAALIANGSWLRATWSLYQDRVQMQQTHGAWLYVALMLALWVPVNMLVLLFLCIRAIWLRSCSTVLLHTCCFPPCEPWSATALQSCMLGHSMRSRKVCCLLHTSMCQLLAW